MWKDILWGALERLLIVVLGSTSILKVTTTHPEVSEGRIIFKLFSSLFHKHGLESLYFLAA